MHLNHLLLLLILETGLGAVVNNPAPKRVIVKHAMGKGMGAYIAVTRQAVQEKLDVFNNIEINGKRAPKLYMPTTPVFDDILTTDHHVVYIDFGIVSSIDSAGEPSISSYGSQFAIVIPLLASSPDGVPKYSLELGQLYQRDRGDVSGGEIVFPFHKIDELTVTDTGAVCKNGSDELRVSFVKSNPCKAPAPILRQEFDALFNESLEFSFSKVDLGYCDRNSLVEDQACDRLERIKSDLEQAFPNVCQFAQVDSEGPCEASFAIETITDGFRKLLLLENGPINVVASESILGNIGIGLKYPCLE